MTISSFLRFLLICAFFNANAVSGFVQKPSPLTFTTKSAPNNNSPSFLPQQISQPSSTRITERLDDDDVQVNLIPDVDSVTLTAIGFGAIAFNFFVLANLGDGGIAGAIATIINTLRQ